MNLSDGTNNGTIRLMLTDFWRPAKLEYIRRNALFKLLSKRFDIVLSDHPDFLLYSCFGVDYLKYDCVRIFYAGENVRPNFNECDYAFSFDYPVNDRNYRLPLYRLHDSYPKVLESRKPEKIINTDRKFCCFLASNPNGSERNVFFEILNQYKKVDSGGTLFNNIGYQIPRGDEIAWMSNFKFSIAFENSSYPGYTTEKILIALAANTIPIYWGNPLIGRDFNPKAIINCHQYNSFREVLDVVRQIDNDDRKYQEMVSQPFLSNEEENEYLKEERILDRFSEIFMNKLPLIPLKIKREQKLSYPFRAFTRTIKKNVF